MTSRPSPRSILVQGQAYAWRAGEGLDASVVHTVEAWIHSEAHRLAAAARRRGLDHDDLAQAGLLGALEAARRFDPERGSSYLAYAKRWIRQAQVEALGAAQDVHMSREALASALAAGALPEVTALDAPAGDDRSLVDLLPADPSADSAEAQEASALLARALARLDGQDRLLLQLRHGLQGEPQTLEQIGHALQPPVGRERARQLLLRAEGRLRSALRAAGLHAPLQPPCPIRLEPSPAALPPAPQPARPGTRRADREARRARRDAARGIPLPLELLA